MHSALCRTVYAKLGEQLPESWEVSLVSSIKTKKVVEKYDVAIKGITLPCLCGWKLCCDCALCPGLPCQVTVLSPRLSLMKASGCDIDLLFLNLRRKSREGSLSPVTLRKQREGAPKILV